MERSFASGVAPVFNVEVEDQHEYFAGGVLVHNCVFALSELMLTPQAAPGRTYVPRERLDVRRVPARRF